MGKDPKFNSGITLADSDAVKLHCLNVPIAEFDSESIYR